MAFLKKIKKGLPNKQDSLSKNKLKEMQVHFSKLENKQRPPFFTAGVYLECGQQDQSSLVPVRKEETPQVQLSNGTAPTINFFQVAKTFCLKCFQK